MIIGYTKCKSCHAENRPEANFCQNCGLAIKSPEEPAPYQKELVHSSSNHDTIYGGVGETNVKFMRLMERIDKNLEDYLAILNRSFEKSDIINMSENVAAMRSSHYHMSCERGYNEEELDFYLKLRNPLEVVADKLVERREGEMTLCNVMDMLFDGRKHEILQSYPLVSDVTQNEILEQYRFMDIDLIDFLGKIAAKVIIHHPINIQDDIDTLINSAKAENPMDRRFMWQVSSCGTHINTEYETFIHGTKAHNAWVNYSPDDLCIFGYVIEVTGGQGNTAVGNVFQLGDYSEHAQYVARNSPLLDATRITYADGWGSNAGKTILVSSEEFIADQNRLMYDSGEIIHVQYYFREFFADLERALSFKRYERLTLPIGDMDEHLQQLSKKVTELRGVTYSDREQGKQTDNAPPAEK